MVRKITIEQLNQLIDEKVDEKISNLQETAIIAMPIIVIWIMKDISKENAKKLEKAFLESYEGSFFTIELEVDQKKRSKLKDFARDLTVSERLKTKAMDEEELVLINNKKIYNEIMNELGDYPMFSIMDKQSSISFTPEEFKRKHKDLYSRDKFKKLLDTEDKKANLNIFWIVQVLGRLIPAPDKAIKKITFYSYPPKGS